MQRRRLVIAACLTAVGVAALWAAGGFRPADDIKRMRPGQEIDQRLYRTKIVKVHVTTLKRLKYAPAERLLVVNAWVTNMSRQTQSTHSLGAGAPFDHGIVLDWTGSGTRPALKTAQAITGNAISYGLQPREATEVAVEYTIGTDTRVPDRLTVGLARFAHTESGILDPRGYWQEEAKDFRTERERDPVSHKIRNATRVVPAIAAEVTLPVGGRR